MSMRADTSSAENLMQSLRRGLRWPGSIRQRLILLFFSITVGAILVIYFYVVPQLESNLTSQKIDDLKRDAASYSDSFQRAIGQREVLGSELDRLTRAVGEQSGAGVTLLGIPRDELDQSGAGLAPWVISDSREARRKPEPSSETVLAAAEEGKIKTATESEGGKRLAQVAKPLLYRGEPAWVVVFSTPLDDVADNVSLIQRQVLIAGLIALLAALISGYYAASALARRVKRLERAAGEVAGGNFSRPIPVDSEDELGQLAGAFNEMQRRLARLDEARKEFIANASHELRTPIFSLAGFVELLQDEDLDEPTRAEFLATMREQVDRLQRLTTQLLDLSRLDAGSLDLALEPVELRELAEQVASEFAVAAARRGTQIELGGADSDGEVVAQCDPERVAQILRVLLDNALTHTGEGTSVTIAANAREGPTGKLRVAQLTVTDDGPGIDSAELPHVFERFESGNARGSGLGLAIARELAEHMRGRLEVASRPGRTAFTLSLPLMSEGGRRDGRPRAGREATTAARGQAPA
jgi:signal transduction histidine kinase